jgi:transcriptional regulator with XRE-family HTH domain
MDVTYGDTIYVTFVIKQYPMKERLIQLLDLEQLSPSKFADIIGVQRSSISHVISGRNKPSFDFLERTLKAFPGLNASWLILGEGTMYEQMGRKVTGNLFDLPAEPLNLAEEHTADVKIREDHDEYVAHKDLPVQDEFMSKTIPREALKDVAAGGTRRIVQVMMIYEDDTFRAFAPAN